MGIRLNGTFWVDGALRRLSSTNGKTVIAFLPTWVKQQKTCKSPNINFVFAWKSIFEMNLFLQYKVGRDVVRNAAVLAPAQRKYREAQGAVWTLWSRLLDFHAFACKSEKRKFENAPKRREFGTTSGSGTLVWQRESRKRFCTSSCLFIEKQILVQN